MHTSGGNESVSTHVPVIHRGEARNTEFMASSAPSNELIEQFPAVMVPVSSIAIARRGLASIEWKALSQDEIPPSGENFPVICG